MVSVIMVSYLGHYGKARTEPVRKLVRAVQSFLDQEIEGSELIVVADGCEKTVQTIDQHFSNLANIKCYLQPKTSGWPGAHRQFGISKASNPYITYLDSDDILLPGRLQSIIEHLDRQEFVIDTNLTTFGKDPRPPKRTQLLATLDYQGTPYYVYNFPRPSGTWCISHRKSVGASWTDSSRRGEDVQFVHNVIKWCKDRNKTFDVKRHMHPIGGYLICHMCSGFMQCDF